MNDKTKTKTMKLSIEEINLLLNALKFYSDNLCSYGHERRSELYKKLEEELKNINSENEKVIAKTKLDVIEELKAFIVDNKEVPTDNNDNLEDLISSIGGIESVVYISNFDDITIIAKKRLLSNEETHKLLIYAERNTNVIITFK